MMYEWEKRKKKKADNEKDNVQQLIVNSTWLFGLFEASQRNRISKCTSLPEVIAQIVQMFTSISSTIRFSHASTSCDRKKL